jgi:hypothetical protein
MLYWESVHSSLYSYIPFALIVIANFLLIYRLKIRSTTTSSSASSRDRQKQMNTSVIALTLLYIVMTLPGTLVSIYYDFLLHSEWGTIVLYIGDSIDITYHALNFIVLFFTNKKFLEEIRNLIGLGGPRSGAISSVNPRSMPTESQNI